MSRRTPRARALCVALATFTVCAVVVACSGATDITRAADPQRLRTSTTMEASSTAAPTTTAAAPTTSAAPGATPPPDELPGDGGDPAGAPQVPPPTEVVRPPAAWVGFGIPQPGSMFENLREDRSLDGHGPVIGLTFDDGPSQYTRPIVEILRYLGVQATFFQIATQAAKNPKVSQEMAAAGMRIGSHSRTHPHLSKLDPASQANEVLGSIDDLANIVGPGIVKCFRPPYGDYDQHVIDLVRERNAAVAMWSYDTLDWKKPAWTTLAAQVVNQAQDRQIILMHDGGGDRTNTIQALPWIIQGLRQRGFTIIPVC